MLKTLTYFFAALILLFAGAILYLQYSTSAQRQIAAAVEQLSERYGVKVATSNVKLHFHFPTMFVEMSDLEVKLPNSSNVLFSGDFLHLQMDLYESIVQRKPIFSEVDFYRSSVTIRLDESGRPEFLALLPATARSGSESHRTSIRFRNSTFTFVNHANATLILANADLAVLVEKENVQLELRSARAESFAEIRVLANGSLRSGRLADGNFYVKTRGLLLAPWGDFFAFNKLGQGGVTGAIWGTLDEGNFSSLTGKLELQDYQGDFGDDGELFGIVKADELFPLKLETEFSWTGTQSTSELNMSRLFLFSPAVEIKQGSFSLRHEHAAEPESHLYFSVPYIDEKSNLYVSKIFSEQSSPSSLTVAFSGNSMRAAAVFSHELLPEAAAQNSALPVRLLIPPSLLATPRLTRFGVAMEAEELRVSDLSIFELPVLIRDFSGSLHLTPSSSGLMVLSHIESAAIAGGQSGGDFFGTFGEEEPVIHTFLEMRSVSLTAVRGLLPFKLMKPKLQDWLNESLLSGVAEHAVLGLSGPVRATFFGEGGGQFFANFQVNDGRIRYHKAVAPVTHIVGEVKLEGKQLTVVASQAQFYGLQLTEARVEVPDLEHPVIKVRVQAAGDLEQLPGYLLASVPSAMAKVPRFLLKGAGDITVEVDAPLARSAESPLRVEGRVHFDNARLQLPEQDLDFDAVNGVLHFDEGGSREGQFGALLAGQQLAVEVTREARNFKIQVQGELSSEYLVSRYLPKFQGRISGASNWDIQLLIPSSDEARSEQGVSFDLRSELLGSTFDLPAPLAKEAAEKREFTAHFIRKNSGMEVEAKLKGIADVHYVMNSLPLPGKVNVSAEFLQAVDVLAWSRYWPENTATPTFSGDGSVELSFAALQLGSTQTGKLWLGVQVDKAQRIRVKARSDWLQGKALIPRDPNATGHINLDRLFLSPEMLSHADASTRVTRLPQLPRIKASVKSLKFGDRIFTTVDTTFRLTVAGVNVSRFSAALPEAKGKLEFSGDWKVGQKTRMKLLVKVQDFGSLLPLKEREAVLEKGNGHVLVDFSWPGSPGDFDFEKITGSAKIALKDGVLQQIDPSAGKLIGLLNLSVLLRRLSLDFSDLLSKGLPFDKLFGDFSFQDSGMHTRKLLINSPTMYIKVQGKTDIEKELYDLNIEVVPNLSGNLPVAASLVGGPLVGGLVFLGEKIIGLGKTLDKLLVLQYHMGGKWAEPEIKFVKAPVVNKLNILNTFRGR